MITIQFGNKSQDNLSFGLSTTMHRCFIIKHGDSIIFEDFVAEDSIPSVEEQLEKITDNPVIKAREFFTDAETIGIYKWSEKEILVHYKDRGRTDVIIRIALSRERTGRWNHFYQRGDIPMPEKDLTLQVFANNEPIFVHSIL